MYSNNKSGRKKIKPMKTKKLRRVRHKYYPLFVRIKSALCTFQREATLDFITTVSKYANTFQIKICR
jgi:hypothetical protein